MPIARPGDDRQRQGADEDGVELPERLPAGRATANSGAQAAPANGVMADGFKEVSISIEIEGIARTI